MFVGDASGWMCLPRQDDVPRLNMPGNKPGVAPASDGPTGEVRSRQISGIESRARLDPQTRPLPSSQERLSVIIDDGISSSEIATL